MNLKNLQQWHTMPKLFFILSALLTGSISSIGQTIVAVAPEKMNVFYIGVDNPVSIAASGSTDDKVTVSISGGGASISKLNAGSYVVRVDQPTDNCTIQVDVDGKTVGTSKFRVRSLPHPTATVGGFSSGDKVLAAEFRRQAGVGLYLRDFPFEVRYEVLSYTFTIEDDNGGVKAVDSQGASFSPEVKQYIDQYAKPGKVINIDNILVKGPNGKPWKIPSLLYHIR